MGFMVGNRHGNAVSGFSLLELLVVIAVIAIIAAIAIPNIAQVTHSAQTAKNLRNAQTLAGTYNAAIAAGLATNAATDVATAVELISAGTNILVGNTVHSFSVDGISEEDRVQAQTYLSFSNGRLVYSGP
jgi:type IV pilus assembly protein PilA